MGLRHYVEESVEEKGDARANIRINSSGSLFSPELVMALASATQLEVLKIIREMRDQKLQALLQDNEQIIQRLRPQILAQPK